MSYYKKTTPEWHIRRGFKSGNSALTYGAVVGTFNPGSDRGITGRNGDHLQFYLSTTGGERYQVDVNTQSRDGSDITVYIAEEMLEPAQDATDENPFGAEQLGADSTAHLSYEKLGLKEKDFVQLSYIRIEDQLEADLNGTQFVAAYGMMFDDGGPNGKGIHDIHFNPSDVNEDGALALYKRDAETGKPKRIWYFFKFQNEKIK